MNSFNSFTIMWNIKIFIYLYKRTAEDKRQNTQNTGNQNIIKKNSSRLSKYSSTGVFIRWLFWLFWHLFSLFFPTLFFVVTILIVWELRRIPNERSYIFNNTSNNLNIFKSDGAHSKLHVAKPHQLKRLLHFFKPF